MVLLKRTHRVGDRRVVARGDSPVEIAHRDQPVTQRHNASPGVTRLVLACGHRRTPTAMGDGVLEPHLGFHQARIFLRLWCQRPKESTRRVRQKPIKVVACLAQRDLTNNLAAYAAGGLDHAGLQVAGEVEVKFGQRHFERPAIKTAAHRGHARQQRFGVILGDRQAVILRHAQRFEQRGAAFKISLGATGPDRCEPTFAVERRDLVVARHAFGNSLLECGDLNRPRALRSQIAGCHEGNCRCAAQKRPMGH